MKKLLLIVWVCALLPVFAQESELLEFPPYLKRGEPGPAIGEVLSDTLWNKGDKPAKFYIQLKAKGAGSLLQNIFKNDEAHLRWLKAQSTATNADERRLQYVLAEAKLQKMLYARGPLLTDPEHVSDTTAGYAALHSITGSALAIQYKQGKMYCHQVLTNVTALATKDSACLPKFFRIVSLPNHHLVEVNYHGRWVAVDPNASSGGLTFKAPNGSYFSTADLLNDTNRIVPDYKLVNTRGEILYRPMRGDTSRYRRLFDNREVIATSFQPKPVRNITGEVILPPGGAMVFTYTNGLSIDTSTTEGKKYVQRLMMLQAKCSPVATAYCDSFLNLIAKNEGISLAQAKDAVYEGKIVFYNGAENFAPFYYEGAGAFPFHPTVQFLVPAHSEPLVLGRDLRAPFLLLDSTFSLWSNKEILSIDQDRVKYLHNGEIRAADATQSILTTINLNAINWLGGLTIDQMGEADKLVIARKRFRSKPGTSAPATGILPGGPNIITPRIVKNK